MVMQNGQQVNLMTWDKRGNLTSEFNIQHGKNTGVALSWYENGNKRSERLYESGELISEQSWDIDGNLIE